MNDGLDRALHRETVQGRGVGEGKISRQIGSAGVYAHVRVAVEALNRGRGNTLSWDAGSTIAARFAAGVIRGICDVVNGGPLAGFELTDVHVSVEEGSYHEEDSTLEVFREVAQQAMTRAVHAAQPLILEAYSPVRVIVPAALRDVVQAVMGPEGGEAVPFEANLYGISANIPTSNVDEFIGHLLAATGGVGQITFSHVGFRPAPEPPGDVQVRVPVL